MINYIETIIEKFGGRPAGSKNEILAQKFFLNDLKKICDKTYLQKFTAPLASIDITLKVFCAIFYVTLALFFISIELSFFLAIINTLFIFGQFISFRGYFDFLLPKKSSINVIGEIKPKKKNLSTIILSAHMDSTTEYRWWKKLGTLGGYIQLFIGFIIISMPIPLFLNIVSNTFSTSGNYIWIYILFTPLTLTILLLRNDYATDGAIDNLSGIVIIRELGKIFSNKRLNHTKLKIISFSGEEPGLKGSKAYVKKYKQQLSKDRAIVVNIDSIKEVKKLQVVKGELFPFVKYPSSLVQAIFRNFKKHARNVTTSIIPMGATDAASFNIAGISAVSIVGLSLDKLDYTYHTREDTIDKIEKEALVKTRDCIKSFITEWDRELT